MLKNPKQNLNQQQNECVSTLAGPIMVLAGPGTGKTFTVIQRLKYMLCEKNIAPKSILCLTFSETAAKEMKERLETEVGEASSGVTISTYHSFCNEIIAKYPSYFDMMEGVDLVDEITKYRIMREIFEAQNPEFLRTEKGDIYHYIKPTISAISEIKKTRTSKAKYFEILETSPAFGGGLKEALEEKEEREHNNKKVTQKILKAIESFEKNIAKAKDVWQIFEIYSKELKSKNYIDFDDMINFVLDIFEQNPDFLVKVASPYEYFLVDEYQDTNFAQNQLVFKLSEGSKSNNVFVVGDDDQIIYGFQGAQSDNLEKFLRYYPQAKVICLKSNFRSTQNILDLSYQVISQDASRIEFNPEFSKFEISKKLTAQNEALKDRNSKINLCNFSESIQEKNFIVAEIEKIITSDDCPQKNGAKDLSEIAILVKQNSLAKEFMDLLKNKNIPSQLTKNKHIFEIEASIVTIFYLKAICNPELHSDKLFAIPMCHPFGFNPYDYSFLLEKNRADKSLNFISAIQKYLDYDWKEPQKIKNFLATYDKLKEKVSKSDLKTFIEAVYEKTGILEFYSDSEIENADNINALEKIIQEAQNFQKIHKSIFLNEFLEHLDIAHQNDIPVEIAKDESKKNAIQLMSLHGSKGREFEYVFMPELQAKKWERYNNPEQLKVPANKTAFEKKSEQLRLLFVGMTRAKHKLYMSFPNLINEREHELTQYIDDISYENSLIHSQTFTPENGFMKEENSLKKLNFDYKIHLSDGLKEEIKNLKLSPSSIATYEKCPRQFLYSQVYRIPSGQFDTKELDYGNAIHRTLEEASGLKKGTKKCSSLVEFLTLFEKNLNEKGIKNTLVHETLLARGKSALEEFYPHFSPEKIKEAEYDLETLKLDNIKLTGKIDRIEINNDGTYFLIDYKTGKSPGAGKTADKKHLDQIRFYKLAYELKNPDKKVSNVGVIYVEDFERNYVKEVCEEDDILIKEKILQTYTDIQNLEFDAICDKQSIDICKRCNYKLLCKINVI